MDISKLKAARPTTLPIPLVDGGQETIVYDRAVLTRKYSRNKGSYDALAGCLITWSFTKDGQSMNPPSGLAREELTQYWLDQFEDIPSDVVAFVWGRIIDDIWAGKQPGGDSSAT